MSGGGYYPPTGPDQPPRFGGWGSPGGGGAQGGGGAGMPGGGGAYVPMAFDPGALIKFPPDYFPPPDAVDFNPSASNTGQVLTAAPVVLATYQLPKNQQGVVRSFLVGVGNFTSTGAVLFGLYINGAPAPGWGAIDIPPQTATYVSRSFGPDETRILIPFGALITLRAQITAGGPFDMYASAHGWGWGSAA